METTKRSVGHQKGQPTWNKGKKGLQVAWNKGLKGRHFSPTTEFKKGRVSLNKGKKASEETRRKQSIAHMGRGEWNVGRVSSIKTRMKISEAFKGIMPTNLKNRQWGNVKSGHYDINGKSIFFRSKWEANYALYLDFLKNRKKIKDWEFETDTFIFHKIKFGTRSYKPDFKVTNTNDTIEYHEVKGWMTPQSKTKLKRMAKYYPEVIIVLIDSVYYRDLQKKLGKIVGFY